MALKTTLEDTQDRLEALLTYANSVTGADDVSVGDAIERLADGYGKTSEGDILEKALIDPNYIADEYINNIQGNITNGALRIAKIKVIRLPNTTTAHSLVAGNQYVEELYLPNNQSYNSSMTNGCTNLKVLDCGKHLSTQNGWFTNTQNLDTLILHAYLEPRKNANAFEQSKFNPTNEGGYVYVPQSLLAQFEASEVWATYANVIEFRPIEGSIYE